jgi:hypothetical protein
MRGIDHCYYSDLEYLAFDSDGGRLVVALTPEIVSQLCRASLVFLRGKEVRERRRHLRAATPASVHG